MTRPRPSDSVRAIVESAIPSIRIEDISSIHTKRLLRPFEVKLADRRTLLLNLSPPPSRLLRSEQWLMQSEAAVIEWLWKDVYQRPREDTQMPSEKSIGKRPQGESSVGGWAHESGLDTSPSPKDQLVSYLPTLIKHSSTSTEVGSAFSLFEPTPGDSISSLGRPLTNTERKSINLQKGRLMRRIANFTSPNGKFGLAVTVLGPPRVPEDAREKSRESKLDFDGTDSWRKTFHLLLEGILRDGEDLAVTISYEKVRTTFHKFSHLLDAITTPRLVVCDADEDDIVLVTRLEKKPEGRQQEDETQRRSPKIKPDPDISSTNPIGEAQASLDKDDATIKITGLRDWSNCIFGDPLFATVFSRATPEFERGFRQSHETRVKHEDGDQAQEQNINNIEDPDNAPTRILLYECYHATVSIVKQFYRPDENSSEREIAARRRLVAALTKLEHVNVSESAGKRPRRLSRGEWPIKRPRGDTPTPKKEPE
ncbi:hypothetical protein HD806DRAFT_525238 [Xylariaceae sp. AK1471]|nr:hypothetical protein HD806DRAFT_525238 [Xylariaceae sp. AK1471]